MAAAPVSAVSVAPQVSVLLPAYNAAATHGRAIASIRAQTYPDWELLVIDDGSTDATRDVAAVAAGADPRVRLLAREHGGIATALNAGLAEARGTFIARMDADDTSHPERLAEQVAWLEAPANRDLGLVSCLVDFGGDRVASAGYALHVDWINTLVTPEQIALNRFVESPLAHPSVMFRRELIERHCGYRDGAFPEDYELWLRWLDAGVRMAKVPRVLLTWDDPPARLSRTDARYDPDAFFRVKTEWVAREVKRLRASPAVFVWGAGRWTRKRAAALANHGLKIAGYIDVDVKKITPALGGSGPPVLGMENIPPPGDAFVLGYVTSRGARDFTRAQLTRRGYREGVNFLMCA